MGQCASCGAIVVVKDVIIFIGLSVLIAGCASGPSQPILTPIEVKIPVPTPIYCSLSKLDRPALPLAGLTADSAPADTIRAYAATVATLKGAVKERDAALAGCAAPASLPITSPAPGDGEA